MNYVLKAGKEETGKGYYVVPSDLEEAELFYQPINSKENIKWTGIEVPAKAESK